MRDEGRNWEAIICLIGVLLSLWVIHSLDLKAKRADTLIATAIVLHQADSSRIDSLRRDAGMLRDSMKTLGVKQLAAEAAARSWAQRVAMATPATLDTIAAAFGVAPVTRDPFYVCLEPDDFKQMVGAVAETPQLSEALRLCNARLDLSLQADSLSDSATGLSVVDAGRLAGSLDSTSTRVTRCEEKLATSRTWLKITGGAVFALVLTTIFL